MDFDYIPKVYRPSNNFFWFVNNPDKFYNFIDEFNIVGVHWAQPQTLTASYFLRLLQEGSSAKARTQGSNINFRLNDEHSNEMNEYYTPLFDHGAMWKTRSGNVLCTAMPYGKNQTIEVAFYKFIKQFGFPKTIKLEFLNDKYKYRPNGNCMIIIYNDVSQKSFDPYCSYEELRRKAIQHSAPATLRYQSSTSTYIRDRYVSEYAKRRANGICQLCEQPAPFNDENGEPYLETHHVIWLADGGEDSIENTVALCPNCHRKMHTLNKEEDVNKLLSVASSL